MLQVIGLIDTGCHALDSRSFISRIDFFVKEKEAPRRRAESAHTFLRSDGIKEIVVCHHK